MLHVAAARRGVPVCVPRTGDVPHDARCVCVPRAGDPTTGVAKDIVEDGVVMDAGESSSSAAAADVGVASSSNCRAPAGLADIRRRVGATAGDAAAGAGDASLLESEGMSSSDEELGIAACAARAESGGSGARPAGPAGAASVMSAHGGENGSWYACDDVTDGVLLDGADSSSAARSTAIVSFGRSDGCVSSRTSSKIASVTPEGGSICNTPTTSSIAFFRHSL